MNKHILIISDQTENLVPRTREQIIDVCIAAHQEPDFKNLFSYMPSGGWHFLAYSEQELVSHAAVSTRWLQPEGHPPLKTAYIDAVATLPAYQGQGFGSAVVRQIARDIDREYIIACLETDKPGFYERLGWQEWRGPLAGRSENGLIPTPEQRGIMVLRLSQSPVLDFDSLLTIEAHTDRIW